MEVVGQKSKTLVKIEKSDFSRRKSHFFVIFNLQFSTFNLSVADGAALRVEVDAHLYYGQTRECKLGGIVLEVNLLHCSLGTLVEF